MASIAATRWLRRPLIPAALIAALGCAAAARVAAGEGALPGYQDYVAFTAATRALAASPSAKVTSLARTRGDRELFLITLSRGDAESKPAMLLVGSVYGPQLVASELALRMARRIIALDESPDVPDAAPSPRPAGEAASKARAKELLDHYTLYIIPRPNPDASEAFFQPPYYERAVNETPTDDDRDGRMNEDPFDDLDRDGWITQLRIEDPAGDFRPHPADPRVLVQVDRAKNETGRYRVISEGIDNDHDEAWNEDPPGGVSLDRNFSFQYPFFKPGAGAHQVCEIESRAIADFAFAHPNIALVFSFGPEDNLIEPWKKGDEAGYRKTEPPAADAERLAFLAEQYRALGGVAGSPGSVKGEGSLARWAYFHYGRWSLAARPWWIPPAEQKPDPKPSEGDQRGHDDVNALAWFAQQGVVGFVDWQPIEHPNFPGQKVEVGGFKPFLRANPPAAQLDALADRQCEFLLRIPGWLPRLRLDEVKLEPLGDGLCRLRVKAINTGYLPTAPAISASVDHMPPAQIKIDAPPGTEWLSGSARVRLEPIAGAGGAVEKTWLLRIPAGGPRKLNISIYAPCLGSDAKSVEAP